MKKTISILIPTYCSDPRPLVSELLRQAQHANSLDDFEIIVVDDGSPDASTVDPLWQIIQWPHCRFMALEENIGRARIRNLLATLARMEWLLYLDCDMTIDRQQFLQDYIDADDSYDVIDGGVSIGTPSPNTHHPTPRSAEGRLLPAGRKNTHHPSPNTHHPTPNTNLRWKYEAAAAPDHTLKCRLSSPYQHFHTANFMVRHTVMKAHPFDQRFLNYGYEDVLFGKQLRQAGIGILHIDNPAGFNTFEDNARFLAKTEESLRTLHEFRDDLRGYSRMLTFVEGIHLAPVRWLIRLVYLLSRPLLRRNLVGSKPSLAAFKLYKIGYYLNL